MPLPTSRRSQDPLLSRKGMSGPWDLNSAHICSKSVWNQPTSFIWGHGNLFLFHCTFPACTARAPTYPALPPPLLSLPGILSPWDLSPSCLPPSWPLSNCLPSALCLFQAISCSRSLTFCLCTIPVSIPGPSLWLVSFLSVLPCF